jgi:SnoaL-like domain
MKRRTALTVVASSCCSLVLAQAAPGDAALREAMARYERAWNDRDVAAWTVLTTADLHYHETYLHTDPERQMITRERSRRAFESAIAGFDFKWQPLRIHYKPGGSATAVMHVVQYALPRTGDKYAAVYETNPAIARWRIDEGRWKLYEYVTYKPMAAEIVRAEGL